MKKFLTVAAIGALVALSGCGKSENAAGPVKREAGNWKNQVKLVKFEVPGMPAEMKDGMAKMMEGAGNIDQCLTKEQADKEDIAAELSKAQAGGGDCKWSKNDVAGGKVDIAGTCTANGQTINMTMVGTVAAKKSDIAVTINGKTPTGEPMEMVIQTNSTHTGPCTTPAAT